MTIALLAVGAVIGATLLLLAQQARNPYRILGSFREARRVIDNTPAWLDRGDVISGGRQGGGRHRRQP